MHLLPWFERTRRGHWKAKRGVSINFKSKAGMGWEWRKTLPAGGKRVTYSIINGGEDQVVEVTSSIRIANRKGLGKIHAGKHLARVLDVCQ